MTTDEIDPYPTPLYNVDQAGPGIQSQHISVKGVNDPDYSSISISKKQKKGQKPD
jgi:hypothetical protein